MKRKYSTYLVSGLSKTKDILDTEYVMNNALWAECRYIPDEEMSKEWIEVQLLENNYSDRLMKECMMDKEWEIISNDYPTIAMQPIGDEYYYLAAVYDPEGKYNLNDTIDYEEYSKVDEYKFEILKAYMEGKTDDEVAEYFTGTKSKRYSPYGVTYVPIYKYGEKNTDKTFVLLDREMRFDFIAKLKKDTDFNFFGVDIIDGYVCYMVGRRELQTEKKHPFRDLKNKIRQWFRNIKMKFTKKEIKDNLYDDLPF